MIYPVTQIKTWESPVTLLITQSPSAAANWPLLNISFLFGLHQGFSPEPGVLPFPPPPLRIAVHNERDY